MQETGDNILDNEWCKLKKENYCRNNWCFHTYPTITNLDNNYCEINQYNNVRTNKIQHGPICKKMNDYRSTITKSNGKYCIGH